MNSLNTRCLNGLWDFIPVFDRKSSLSVPADGWVSGIYQVPSFWTKPLTGVKLKGEDHFHGAGRSVLKEDGVEFLFDGFGYPVEWARTRTGWVRRTVEIDRLDPTRRYFILLEGVLPQAHLFVNGHLAGHNTDPCLPMEIDITEHLHDGSNEIALYIDKYDTTENGQFVVPAGNELIADNSGLWQDVYLIERGDVHVEDMTIVTSVRQGSIAVKASVHNSSDRARTVALDLSIVDCPKRTTIDKDRIVKSLPTQTVTVDPGQSVTVEVSAPWADAEKWYPENPKLYKILAQVVDDAQVVDECFERFGFREVWIDGPQVMLNGYPMHLFSDWGHKSSPFHLTEPWILKWFGMLRDANMNHSRLHAHPHPRLYLDLADEQGILITNETGIFGAGKQQASQDMRFWENSREHVRRFVARDKNHPSLILWSVENEMRWNEDVAGTAQGGESSLMKDQLRELRLYFDQLDPTRPAYHDGDSTLWNEGEQPILSRHYGNGCSGYGWWDRTQPLFSSEMCWYHQMGPNTTQHLGGDAVHADYGLVDDLTGWETELVIETGRSLGVSCFCPWNLSCMTNLRPPHEPVELDYDDFTTPGMKPRHVAPQASEFAFWKEGKGYIPHNCFDHQARAFRPLAVIDRSLRTMYFAGVSIEREVTVVNDTPTPVKGALQVRVSCAGKALAEHRWDLDLPRGGIQSRRFEITLPENLPDGECEYTASFSDRSEVLDEWTRTFRVERPGAGTASELKPLQGTTVGFYRADSLMAAVADHGVSCRAVDDLDTNSLEGTAVLVIGAEAVVPGSNQNAQVRAFARAGGRVVVMEQKTSLFPSVQLENKPILKAHVRAPHHPVASGFTSEDFFMWGDDPYPAKASDSLVASRMYRKDDLAVMTPILDSGEGRWGAGDLEYTPLFEVCEGKGLVLACQLRLTEKIDQIPSAARLFLRLLNRAAAFAPAQEAGTVLSVAGSDAAAADKAVQCAKAGGTVLATGLTPGSIESWSKALQVPLAFAEGLGDVYQAIRCADDPLLDGVSNDDTFGVEGFLYRQEFENIPIGAHFLAHADGLEPLLVTPTKSCMKELNVQGGHAERMLGYAVSRAVLGEKPPEAVVLGRVSVGSGQVILNQFTPPRDKRLKFGRLQNRLRANLGAVVDTSLLEGESTSRAKPVGTGVAGTVHRLVTQPTGELEQTMLRCMQPTGEEHVSKPILNLPGWQKVSEDSGVVKAEGISDGEAVYLFYLLNTPEPRSSSHHSLPTTLECAGEGEVDLYVNAKHRGRAEPNGQPAQVRDITLDPGWNPVLVRWRPQGAQSTLRMQWQTSDGGPETAFDFITF